MSIYYFMEPLYYSMSIMQQLFIILLNKNPDKTGFLIANPSV